MTLKQQFKMSVCVLASSVMFSSAFADIGFKSFNLTNTSICDNSIGKICTETEAQRAERDRYVEKLKKEISTEAELKAIPRIEEMKKKISKIRFIKRALETIKIRNQETMRAAKKRVGDLESVVTSAESQAILKSNLTQAINESSFDLVTKEKFKKTISEIVIGNFADYLEQSGLEDSVLMQMLGNACGSDGLVDNAFATTLNNQKYVLVCPGFLITMTQKPSAEERMNGILHAISHEMGHHIDNSKVGNELYAPFLGCLSKNYANKFNRSKDDQKFCEKNSDKPEKCSSQVVLSHAGELIADEWGIRATEVHMRRNVLSTIDSEKLLVESWAKLCGTGDEGIHPTGDFRIGTLMRKDIGLSDYLGCTASTDLRPACNFNGESR